MMTKTNISTLLVLIIVVISVVPLPKIIDDEGKITPERKEEFQKALDNPAFQENIREVGPEVLRYIERMGGLPEDAMISLERLSKIILDPGIMTLEDLNSLAVMLEGGSFEEEMKKRIAELLCGYIKNLAGCSTEVLEANNIYFENIYIDDIYFSNSLFVSMKKYFYEKREDGYDLSRYISVENMLFKDFLKMMIHYGGIEDFKKVFGVGEKRIEEFMEILEDPRIGVPVETRNRLLYFDSSPMSILSKEELLKLHKIIKEKTIFYGIAKLEVVIEDGKVVVLFAPIYNYAVDDLFRALKDAGLEIEKKDIVEGNYKCYLEPTSVKNVFK